MLGCVLQFFIRRQIAFLASFILRDAVFAVVMPDIQHGSDRDVEFSAGEIIVFLRFLKQADDLRVHFNRLDAGIVVDRLEVVHAIVGVVDIKQIVIAAEQRKGIIEMRVEDFLGRRFLKLNDGIESIINAGIAVVLHFVFCRGRGAC